MQSSIEGIFLEGATTRVELHKISTNLFKLLLMESE